jgi:FixJ family two-component response regulator
MAEVDFIEKPHHFTQLVDFIEKDYDFKTYYLSID